MVYRISEYEALEAENKAKCSSESKGKPVEIFQAKVNNAA